MRPNVQGKLAAARNLQFLKTADPPLSFTVLFAYGGVMLTCEVRITEEQLRELQGAEAVLLREYENDAGDRWASYLRCGDADEMQVIADTPQIFVVPNGMHILGNSVVMVSDLLQPVGE